MMKAMMVLCSVVIALFCYWHDVGEMGIARRTTKVYASPVGLQTSDPVMHPVKGVDGGKETKEYHRNGVPMESTTKIRSRATAQDVPSASPVDPPQERQQQAPVIPSSLPTNSSIPVTAPVPLNIRPVAQPITIAPTGPNSGAAINECEDPTLNACHENANCTNTEGSYTCTCKPNYFGDGANSCEPVLTRDVPDLTITEITKIMVWIKLKVTQVKIPFCWKGSYPRTAGTLPTECPTNKELIGALCYTKCPNEFTRVGVDCHQICPPGFVNQGLYCRRTEYGRGVGYPLWDKAKCERNHGTCEQCLALYYPTCQSGYSPSGCNICRPKVPDCPRLGMYPGVDLSCAKKTILGDPTQYICASHLERNGALCYPPCKAGYYGDGPVCWTKCTIDQTDCTAACANDSAKCESAVLNQATSSLVQAANIVTLGLATPTTSGSEVISIKTSTGAIKVVGGTTQVGKAFVKLVNALQSASPKGASTLLTTRTTNSRTGTVTAIASALTTYYPTVFFAAEAFRQAYVNDFVQQTSFEINEEIHRHYAPLTANFIKRTWADIQVQEIVKSSGLQISNALLNAAANIDISGVKGSVEAYLKPICKEDIPFPCTNADLILSCA